MHITNKTLPAMADINIFMGTYTGYVTEVYALARLFPKFSPQRLIEAHGAWLNDMDRVGAHEPKLDNGLDHFKQCGHLAFWLRRMSPVVDAVDTTENIADAAGYPITDDEVALREILFPYANEYLAFDFCFQFCKFYEMNKAGGSNRAERLILNRDYFKILCHFLKYKTVSPHALFAIFKSLFAE